MAYRGIEVPVSAEMMPLPVLVALSNDDYEVPELEAGTALLRPGDRMLELGTGLGIVSGILAKRFPDCQFKTYEANPDLLPHIRTLHETNAIANVDVHNAMLEPEPGEETRAFYMHPYFTEGSIIKTDRSLGAADVPVLDLNTVIGEFDPTVVMCDIEGAEEIVIPKADLSRVRALILELHPKLLSRASIKAIFDACSAHGLYLRVENSSKDVVAFERV
ncbi:MAG: FkbM family methyltransferase [Pseudomonadota bacterium]